MASLWLQSVSLLVLLMASWPGSRATSLTEHLCGENLIDALNLVCGEGGFMYNPRRGTRDVDSLLGLLVSSENEGPEFAFKDQKKKKMVKRSIVEECCFKPCSILDLQRHCK